MLMRRPLPFAIAATAVMLLIASPALSLKLEHRRDREFPKDFETRVGFELAAQQLGGEGALGPIQLVVDGTDVDGFGRLRTSSRCPASKAVSPARPSRDGQQDARRRHAPTSRRRARRRSRSSTALRDLRPPVATLSRRRRDRAEPGRHGRDLRVAVEGRACSWCCSAIIVLLLVLRT